MNLNLPPVDDRYVKSKVKKGYYSNVTEVVRDAVRRMREQDRNEQPPRLMKAVQKGLDDVAAGRVKTYSSVKALIKDIEREGEREMKSGKPFEYDPDVIGPGDDGPWGENLS